MSRFDALAHEDQLAALAGLANEALALYARRRRPRARLINLSENATYQGRGRRAADWALRVHRDGYHSRDGHRLGAGLGVALREAGVVRDAGARSATATAR